MFGQSRNSTFKLHQEQQTTQTSNLDIEIHSLQPSIEKPSTKESEPKPCVQAEVPKFDLKYLNLDQLIPTQNEQVLESLSKTKGHFKADRYKNKQTATSNFLWNSKRDKEKNPNAQSASKQYPYKHIQSNEISDQFQKQGKRSQHIFLNTPELTQIAQHGGYLEKQLADNIRELKKTTQKRILKQVNQMKQKGVAQDYARAQEYIKFNQRSTLYESNKSRNSDQKGSRGELKIQIDDAYKKSKVGEPMSPSVIMIGDDKDQKYLSDKRFQLELSRQDSLGTQKMHVESPSPQEVVRVLDRTKLPGRNTQGPVMNSLNLYDRASLQKLPIKNVQFNFDLQQDTEITAKQNSARGRKLRNVKLKKSAAGGGQKNRSNDSSLEIVNSARQQPSLLQNMSLRADDQHHLSYFEQFEALGYQFGGADTPIHHMLLGYLTKHNDNFNTHDPDPADQAQNNDRMALTKAGESIQNGSEGAEDKQGSSSPQSMKNPFLQSGKPMNTDLNPVSEPQKEKNSEGNKKQTSNQLLLNDASDDLTRKVVSGQSSVKGLSQSDEFTIIKKFGNADETNKVFPGHRNIRQQLIDKEFKQKYHLNYQRYKKKKGPAEMFGEIYLGYTHRDKMMQVHEAVLYQSKKSRQDQKERAGEAQITIPTLSSVLNYVNQEPMKEQIPERIVDGSKLSLFDLQFQQSKSSIKDKKILSSETCNTQNDVNETLETPTQKFDSKFALPQQLHMLNLNQSQELIKNKELVMQRRRASSKARKRESYVNQAIVNMNMASDLDELDESVYLPDTTRSIIQVAKSNQDLVDRFKRKREVKVSKNRDQMLIIGKQVTNENQEKESGQPSQPSLYKIAPTLNAGRLDTPSPVMENANNTCRNSKFGDFPKRNQVKPILRKSDKNTLPLRSSSTCKHEETVMLPQMNNDTAEDRLGNISPKNHRNNQRKLVGDLTPSNLQRHAYRSSSRNIVVGNQLHKTQDQPEPKHTKKITKNFSMTGEHSTKLLSKKLTDTFSVVKQAVIFRATENQSPAVITQNMQPSSVRRREEQLALNNASPLISEGTETIGAVNDLVAQLNASVKRNQDEGQGAAVQLEQSEELLLPEIVKLQATNEEGNQETLFQEKKKQEDEEGLNIYNIKATLAAIALGNDNQMTNQLLVDKRNQGPQLTIHEQPIITRKEYSNNISSHAIIRQNAINFLKYNSQNDHLKYEAFKLYRTKNGALKNNSTQFMRNQKRLAQSNDARTLLQISQAATLNHNQFKAMRNSHDPAEAGDLTQTLKESLIVPSNPYPNSKERVKNIKKLHNYIAKVKRVETERINQLRKESMEKEKYEKKLQANQDLKHALMSQQSNFKQMDTQRSYESGGDYGFKEYSKSQQGEYEQLPLLQNSNTKTQSQLDSPDRTASSKSRNNNFAQTQPDYNFKVDKMLMDEHQGSQEEALVSTAQISIRHHSISKTSVARVAEQINNYNNESINQFNAERSRYKNRPPQGEEMILDDAIRSPRELIQKLLDKKHANMKKGCIDVNKRIKLQSTYDKQKLINMLDKAKMQPKPINQSVLGAKAKQRLIEERQGRYSPKPYLIQESGNYPSVSVGPRKPSQQLSKSTLEKRILQSAGESGEFKMDITPKRDSTSSSNKMIIPKLFACNSPDDGQTYVGPNTVELDTEFKPEPNLRELRDFALMNKDLMRLNQQGEYIKDNIKNTHQEQKQFNEKYFTNQSGVIQFDIAEALGDQLNDMNQVLDDITDDASF